MSPQPEICTAIQALLEPYVDGELSPEESLKVREHTAHCPACAAELRLCTDILEELRGLPELDAPPAVLARVRQEAQAVVPFPITTRERKWRRPLALAAMLALALLGSLLVENLRGVRGQNEPHPTPEQVAQATEQARYALAYVARVSRRAGLELKDEVLPQYLVAPAARTLSRSLKDNLLSANDPAARQGS
ncbi:MAG TPA: anti-sigma factor [Thermoanaerobaculia bacterium]|nr:anti-sigma factor [Thermoanaerobaculia bacterium]